MANNKDARSCAQAEQDESVFINGMIRVIDQEGIFIDENGLGFLKRDAMLFPI
jgi:hypothetical protein